MCTGGSSTFRVLGKTPKNQIFTDQISLTYYASLVKYLGAKLNVGWQSRVAQNLQWIS